MPAPFSDCVLAHPLSTLPPFRRVPRRVLAGSVHTEPSHPAVKQMAYRRKRHCTNPVRGPFHFRAPSKMVWHTIRGMVPHKTDRGAEAMKRLKVFDGCPTPYDKVCYCASVRVVRRFCVLGAMHKKSCSAF